MTSRRNLIDLPRAFTENVRGVCGIRGDEWLRSLPDLIGELEQRWQITANKHFGNLSYNYVAPAKRIDGSEVVLKLGLPVEDGEIYSEAAYLRLKDGNGVVRLIEEAPEIRGLLVARAIPGSDLKACFANAPHKAVPVGIEVLKTLAEGPQGTAKSFLSLERWFAKLNGADRLGFPAQTAEKALEIYQRSQPKDQFLLHGDLHHENILSSGPGSFLAIDPKGITGDIRYDIAVFLNNHRGWLNRTMGSISHLNAAVAKFAEAFGFSSRDVREWAFAQQVLGSYWTFEEKGPDWQARLTRADVWGI